MLVSSPRPLRHRLARHRQRRARLHLQGRPVRARRWRRCCREGAAAGPLGPRRRRSGLRRHRRRADRRVRLGRLARPVGGAHGRDRLVVRRRRALRLGAPAGQPHRRADGGRRLRLVPRHGRHVERAVAVHDRQLPRLALPRGRRAPAARVPERPAALALGSPRGVGGLLAGPRRGAGAVRLRGPGADQLRGLPGQPDPDRPERERVLGDLGGLQLHRAGLHGVGGDQPRQALARGHDPGATAAGAGLHRRDRAAGGVVRGHRARLDLARHGRRARDLDAGLPPLHADPVPVPRHARARAHDPGRQDRRADRPARRAAAARRAARRARPRGRRPVAGARLLAAGDRALRRRRRAGPCRCRPPTPGAG